MSEWTRVNRQNKCKVCDRPDWCTYTDRGICCMRVESNISMRNGGWWHPNDSQIKYECKPKPKPPTASGVPPDFEAMLSTWRSESPDRLQQLAEQLKLPVSTIHELGTVYSKSHQAYAFPMYDSTGGVLGIRLRNTLGEKWSVKGSHAGLFIPYGFTSYVGQLFICEGPTDTAAALMLGLNGIGRAACLGQEDLVVKVIEMLQIKIAYICCDNDEPGLKGAKQLQGKLPCKVIRFIPPAKDLRMFAVNGGTRDLLFSVITASSL